MPVERERLTDADLPGAHGIADAESKTGQMLARLFTGAELGLLAFAALASVGSWKVADGKWDLVGAIAFVTLLVALGLHIGRVALRTEQRWYLGRAAAESVKTLAWRYAVAGDPFPMRPESDDAAEKRARAELLSRLQQVLRTVEELGLGLPLQPQSADQITPVMNDTRRMDLAGRKDAYRRGRIDDQIGWYTSRARRHRKAAIAWGILGAVATIGGLVAAALRFLLIVELNFVGLASAMASGAVAWTQLNQHRILASSYSVAAQELGLVRERIDDSADDASWPLFVSDAEDAISREHTMWLARRGHPRSLLEDAG